VPFLAIVNDFQTNEIKNVTFQMINLEEMLCCKNYIVSPPLIDLQSVESAQDGISLWRCSDFKPIKKLFSVFDVITDYQICFLFKNDIERIQIKQYRVPFSKSRSEKQFFEAEIKLVNL